MSTYRQTESHLEELHSQKFNKILYICYFILESMQALITLIVIGNFYEVVEMFYNNFASLFVSQVDKLSKTS